MITTIDLFSYIGKIRIVPKTSYTFVTENRYFCIEINARRDSINCCTHNNENSFAISDHRTYVGTLSTLNETIY